MSHNLKKNYNLYHFLKTSKETYDNDLFFLILNHISILFVILIPNPHPNPSNSPYS